MPDKTPTVTFQEPGFRSAGIIFTFFSIILIIFNLMVFLNAGFRHTALLTVLGKGSLTVEGDAGLSATIYIDTVQFGDIPVTGDVLPGEHTIKIKKDNFTTLLAEFSIDKNEQKTIRVFSKPPLRQEASSKEVILVLTPTSKTQASATPRPLPTASATQTVGSIPFSTISPTLASSPTQSTNR